MTSSEYQYRKLIDLEHRARGEPEDLVPDPDPVGIDTHRHDGTMYMIVFIAVISAMGLAYIVSRFAAP